MKGTQMSLVPYTPGVLALLMWSSEGRGSWTASDAMTYCLHDNLQGSGDTTLAAAT